MIENFKITTLHNIIQETYSLKVNEFLSNVNITNKKEHAITPIEDSLKNTDSFKDIIFNVTDSSLFHQLAEHNHHLELDQHSFDELKEEHGILDISMTSIESFENLEKSIKIITRTSEALGDKFYGAILIPKHHRSEHSFNPLHPLVSYFISEIKKNKDEFRDQYDKFFDEKYKIIIYTFDNSKGIEKFSNTTNYNKEIINLVVGTQTKDFYSLKYANFMHNKISHTVSYNIELNKDGRKETINHLDQLSDRLKYIVPNQILNHQGVIYPYYGTSFINNENGMNLTPMFSANIGEPGEEEGTMWSNICTGEESYETISGKLTLNHSNLNSPLNGCIFNRGSFVYAKQCNQISFDLYKSIFKEKAYDKDRFLQHMAALKKSRDKIKKNRKFLEEQKAQAEIEKSARKKKKIKQIFKRDENGILSSTINQYDFEQRLGEDFAKQFISEIID